MTRRPFPLAVPPELTAYILDFHWDLELLHALDLPAVELPVADLAHHLDLRHPLDVVRRPDDRITILDGVHRLLRAELEERDVVTARVLPWTELDRIAARV
jgi:hypothetical protein